MQQNLKCILIISLMQVENSHHFGLYLLQHLLVGSWIFVRTPLFQMIHLPLSHDQSMNLYLCQNSWHSVDRSSSVENLHGILDAFFTLWHDNLLKNDNYTLKECIGSINNNGSVPRRNVRHLGQTTPGPIDSSAE